MSILVDSAQYPAHGRLWAHLASDTSLTELHDVAARLGVPRRAFEGDHYDVLADVVTAALGLGAEQVSTRELLSRVRAAGLRTPKRRGERVFSTTMTAQGRVDVVRAAIVPLPHGAHRVVRLHAGGVVLESGDLPEVTGLGARRVLGFRRRWGRVGGETVVVHDGLLLDGSPRPDQLSAVAVDLAVDRVLGPRAQPWWRVLLEDLHPWD
ncbi:MAG: DUF4031 domain-containing protein [Janthinobacterium lividum]